MEAAQDLLADLLFGRAPLCLRYGLQVILGNLHVLEDVATYAAPGPAMRLLVKAAMASFIFEASFHHEGVRTAVRDLR